MVDLLNARKTLSSSSGGATVGVYYVEVGLSGSSESEFLNNMTKRNSQVYTANPDITMFYRKIQQLAFLNETINTPQSVTVSPVIRTY